MKQWVKFPTNWTKEGLLDFKWSDGGSDNVAALMVLIIIAHHANEEDGVARITYETLQSLSGLSRSKISKGLQLLDARGLVERQDRSHYRLIDFRPQEGGWGKLPARSMYQMGKIRAFEEFHLRKKTELDALKLFLLFVARRDNRSNYANISYEKICKYTGMPRNSIRSGLSFLTLLGLVHIDKVPGREHEHASNAYRLAQIDPYRHNGTTGKSQNSVAGDFS